MRKKEKPQFKPLQPVVVVFDDSTGTLSLEDINSSKIGEKAYGLSCLPRLWTLPFLVISDKLFSMYKMNGTTDAEQRKIITKWLPSIQKALLKLGISNNDSIIVRSSGHDEGLDERGKYHSTAGKFSDLQGSLINCLNKIIADNNFETKSISLIVQKHIELHEQKGHLSNERRCYKEARDWLGEFEEGAQRTFQINLRNWRKKTQTDRAVSNQLSCGLSTRITETLNYVASWAHERGNRIHFEWVWDGKNIFIVQADREIKAKGLNPEKLDSLISFNSDSFEPSILERVTQSHAQLFRKIRNVFTYSDLGLDVVPFFILQDRKVIQQLAAGIIPITLKKDIDILVQGSLVIRVDLSTDQLEKSQMLPRTEEIREAEEATSWLVKTSKELLDKYPDDQIAFIFHNFVPARASAFAFAAPNQRKVQIEALWGLPEGLYYNSHDKYVVDTLSPKIEEIEQSQGKFVCLGKPRYKHYFVTPDAEGRWRSDILAPPYDWGKTIKNKAWLKQIAMQSRKIAEAENKSLSIMWFIDVLGHNTSKILPWYHESFDMSKMSRATTHRRKTQFDETFVIKTSADIEKLKLQIGSHNSNIRRVRLQLLEEKLLRDKNTLQLVGNLCKQIGAVILLEGGVLSHAYYQLLETEAIVEVLSPFDSYDDKQEFNKLVRDKVSSNIEGGGEIANTVRLEGEPLLRALREKLIEEAFEVLDSIDQDSIIGELADVSEVIDNVLIQIGATKKELAKRQKQKREKAGGFKDGVVLIDTRNPLPTETESSTLDDPLFHQSSGKSKNPNRLKNRAATDASQKIAKWQDRREHQNQTEEITQLKIPIVLDNWKVSIGKEMSISAIRIGSKIQVTLSSFTEKTQLSLFDDLDKTSKFTSE